MARNKQGPKKDIAFKKMAEIHKNASRGYWIYGVLLVALGVALLIAAAAGMVPWLIGVLVGIVLLAVSAIPIRDAIERGERVEGLAVLEEEWSSLIERGDSAANEREQFLALMRRLYA